MSKKITTPKPAATSAPAAPVAAAPAGAGRKPPGVIIEVGAGAAPTDEGAYSARIAAVLDLGVQAPPVGGKGQPKRQIAVGFELYGATSGGIELTEPPTMYRRYGVSFGPKAELPKLLRAMLGRDPAPGEKLPTGEWIARPVTLTIEHNVRPDGSGGARVASVTRCAVKGLPELAAAPLLYPGAMLSELPEWAQVAIAGALHPGAASAPPAGDGYGDDDVQQ